LVGIQLNDVGQHLARVRGRVGHLVYPAQHAGRVDQEGEAASKVRVLLIGIALGSVGATGRVPDVGEQPKRKLLGLGERSVLLWRVEGDADDLYASFDER
jgi:hypothetical protein